MHTNFLQWVSERKLKENFGFNPGQFEDPNHSADNPMMPSQTMMPQQVMQPPVTPQVMPQQMQSQPMSKKEKRQQVLNMAKRSLRSWRDYKAQAIDPLDDMTPNPVDNSTDLYTRRFR